MPDVIRGEQTGSGVRGINWSAAIWASVIAGLVFAALEVLLAWINSGQPWLPLHRIGAIALGASAMTPPDTFDLKIIVTAVVIHMVLAVIYGVILAFIINRLSTLWAVVIGGAYGLALYLVNFYGFSAMFPWWVEARGVASIGTHIVQSALMAYIYKAMDDRPGTA